MKVLTIHIGASCSGSTSLQYALTEEQKNTTNGRWIYMGRYVKATDDGHRYMWTKHSQHMIRGLKTIRANDKVLDKGKRDPIAEALQDRIKNYTSEDCNIIISDENIGEGIIVRGSYIGRTRNTITDTIKYYKKAVNADKVVVVQITRKEIIKWIKSIYKKTVGSMEIALSLNDFAKIYIESAAAPLKLVNKLYMKGIIESNGWEFKHFYLEELNKPEVANQLYEVMGMRNSTNTPFPKLNSTKENDKINIGAQYITAKLVNRYQNDMQRIRDQNIIYNSGMPQNQLIDDNMALSISKMISKGKENEFEHIGKRVMTLDKAYEKLILDLTIGDHNNDSVE